MEKLEYIGLYEACVQAYECGKNNKKILESSVSSHGVDSVVIQPVKSADGQSSWVSSTRLQLVLMLNEFGLNDVEIDLDNLKKDMEYQQTEFAMYAAPVWFNVEDYESSVIEDEDESNEDAETLEEILPSEESDSEQQEELGTHDVTSEELPEYDQNYVDSIRPDKNNDKSAKGQLEEYGRTLGVELDKRQGFSKMEISLKKSLGV